MKLRLHQVLSCVIAVLLQLTASKIVNQAITRNMLVPYGNYTTMRIAGFGGAEHIHV